MKDRIQGLFYYTQKLGYLKEKISSDAKDENKKELMESLSAEQKARVHFLWAKQLFLRKACNEKILSEEDGKRLLQRSLQSSLNQGNLYLRSLKEGLLSFSQVEKIARQLVEKGALLPWEEKILLRAGKTYKAEESSLKDLTDDSFLQVLSQSTYSSGSSSHLEARLGPYLILEEIGSGGMGKVYKAYHEQLDKTVAIKVLLQEYDIGEVERDRFLAEAQLIAKLNHPNIVKAQDFGSIGGRDYIVMDFIEGQSLGELLSEGKTFSLREGVKIICDVALAMAYAHQEGVIHRDLKPGNLMINKEGKPLIMDFGLAKNAQGAKDITKTGEILGTPRYMAPEQALGQTSQISTQTDVYALGAILYEVITERKAIEGENSFNIIYQIVHSEITPPRQVMPSIALDLETICLKSLEKEPSKRYPSAQEMADDMTRFLNGEMVLARPHSFWQKTRKKIYKHRVLFISLLLLFVGGAGTFVWNERVLNERMVVEEIVAAWNVWWQDWEESFKKDYQLLESVDQLLLDTEKLMEGWEKTPEKRFDIWASYDEKIFSKWLKYKKSLVSFPNFLSKYTSLVKTYEKLKEKKQWEELGLSAKGKIRLSQFLSENALSFPEKEIQNPARIMIKEVFDKIISLRQKGESLLDKHRKKSIPSQLEMIRWYLAYGEQLLKGLGSSLGQNDLFFSVEKENFAQIKANREHFVEQAWKKFVSNENSEQTLSIFKKVDKLQELCQVDITQSKAYFQLAQTKHQLSNYENARIGYRKCNQREKQALSFYYLMDVYFSLSRFIIVKIHRSKSAEEILRERGALNTLMERNLQSFDDILKETRSLEKREFFEKMQGFYRALTQAEKHISETYRRSSGRSYLELYLVPRGTNRMVSEKIKLTPKMWKDYLQGIDSYHNLLTILEQISGSYLPQWISYWKSVIYLDLDLLGEVPDNGASYLERALVSGKEAVEKEPANSRFQKQLAKIYSIVGDFDEVAQVYHKIIPPIHPDLSPDDFSYVWELNKSYYFALFRQGEIKKAQAILETYLTYFQELALKDPERLAEHPLEEVYQEPDVFWLAFIYFSQNETEKIRQIFSHWKCHEERPNIKKSELMIQYWIYFVCALKINEREKGVQALQFLWEEMLKEHNKFANQVKSMSSLLAIQIPFLRNYDKILTSEAEYRKLPQLFVNGLEDIKKKHSHSLSYRLVDQGPLVKLMVDFLEKDPIFEKEIKRISKNVVGSGDLFHFIFYAAIKIETDFREKRLVRIKDLSSSKVLFQRAVGYFRQSLYSKDSLPFLENAKKDLLSALEKDPANANYHYASALVFAALSQKERAYSYLAFFHVRLAFELGWSHKEFLTKDPYWKPFLSQNSFRLWKKSSSRNLLDYSFREIKKRSDIAFTKGYKRQAKQIIQAYQSSIEEEERRDLGSQGN